jgi:hypothetical protein
MSVCPGGTVLEVSVSELWKAGLTTDAPPKISMDLARYAVAN